jgi:anthranilate/para-aminobenzoate synthase component I
MLVDLARNDVNRVCQPETVKVDHLMRLEKFSHVIHLTSQVSGMLRKDKTRSVCPTSSKAVLRAFFYVYTGLMLSGQFSLPGRFQAPQKSKR